MNFLRSFVSSFIILGFVSVGSAQENNELIRLSISEAQTYALQNNRAVQSAKIEIDITGKKVWETLAIGLPQVSFAANYLHQFRVPVLSFGPFLDINSLPDGPITRDDLANAYVDSPPISLGVKNNTTLDFTISQLIFSGEYLVGLQATKVLRQVSDKTLVKTEDQTKESVAGTYYLILVLDENIRLLAESVKAVDKTYNDMLEMSKEGLIEESDIDQITINKSNIKTLLNSLTAQKEISLKLLKFQLGMEFEQKIELIDSIPGIIAPDNLSLPAQDFDVRNSIDFQLISIQERVTELMLKREKSKFLPTLSAFYRHQEQTNQPSFNFAVKDVLGASLSFPILTSGMQSAKVSQAKFNLQKIRLAKTDAEQGLVMEYESAKSDYQTAYSNYTTNRESMDLSKNVYDKTIIKYTEGVASSLDLAQSQNQFLTAESNYYNALLTLLYAKAKLDRILKIN